MPPPGALTPRVRNLLVVLMLVLVGVSVHRLHCAAPPGPYTTFSGRTMGTTWNVKVAGDPILADEMRKLGTLIQGRLDRVNALMSTWDPTSEISRFNEQRTREPFPVSPETMATLETAFEVHHASRGALDITVGPLVEAWGFGPSDHPGQSPTPETIARIDAFLGQHKLALDTEAGTLGKHHPEIEIDLSAIAKGYGVDAVAWALEDAGRRDYLVEVGGELRAAGVRRDGRVWHVAIERPEAGARAIHEALPLRDLAMATSGDYRNFYERDGQRLSHTIDPRTRAPIEHRLASVTVVAEEAALADAWATALNVLGPTDGYTLATELGLAAYLIERLEDGQYRINETPAFAQLRAAEPSEPK